MSERIENIAERLNRVITETKEDLVARLGAQVANAPPPLIALNNTSLLLGALAKFYSEPRAEYFPRAISSTVQERLIQLENSFTALPVAEQLIPADAASNLLKQLDDFYAYCLQYGLISYGFTDKIAQEQIELIRIAREKIELLVQTILTASNDRQTELAKSLTTFGNEVAQAVAGFKSTLGERLNEIKPLTDGLADAFSTGQANAEKLQENMKVGAEDAIAVASLRSDLEALSLQATTDFESVKNDLDTQLKEVQGLGKQIQEYEADAKARLQAVADSRATIKDQLTEITAFYADIETHRSQMTEAGKAAQSNLAALRESSERSVSDFRERTEKTIQTNEELIGQIKDHLQKAIGASLFTAFDTRRRHITYTSWVWGILLLMSVSGTITFAIWFVYHLAELAKADVHPALVYARLVIVAPLAFLVGFTAKRYASERRAEEEYAFKSAISVSLDSYRDLIARMTQENHNTAFVERLVLEIFDNPTKRLYGTTPAKCEKDEVGLLDLVKEALDKIPKAE
jgi:hypothetical protein